MRFTEDNIKDLAPNEVFVFGSNIAGIHGAGAAKDAYKKFGAKLGVGCGRTGKCYAIPTKDEKLSILPLASIGFYVADFLMYAMKHEETTFLVTKIGCGLAGYRPEQIAPLFEDAPDNVIIPRDFYLIIHGELETR